MLGPLETHPAMFPGCLEQEHHLVELRGCQEAAGSLSVTSVGVGCKTAIMALCRLLSAASGVPVAL